jgi:hypothetical protein
MQDGSMHVFSKNLAATSELSFLEGDMKNSDTEVHRAILVATET